MRHTTDRPDGQRPSIVPRRRSPTPSALDLARARQRDPAPTRSDRASTLPRKRTPQRDSATAAQLPARNLHSNHHPHQHPRRQPSSAAPEQATASAIRPQATYHHCTTARHSASASPRRAAPRRSHAQLNAVVADQRHRAGDQPPNLPVRLSQNVQTASSDLKLESSSDSATSRAPHASSSSATPRASRSHPGSGSWCVERAVDTLPRQRLTATTPLPRRLPAKINPPQTGSHARAAHPAPRRPAPRPSRPASQAADTGCGTPSAPPRTWQTPPRCASSPRPPTSQPNPSKHPRRGLHRRRPALASRRPAATRTRQRRAGRTR